MTPDLQVVEDAIVDAPDRSRPPTPWVWLVVAFAVGIGFGAVFFGPVVSPTLDTGQPGPDTPLAPGDPIGPVGVSVAIPEFPDAIVAIVDGQALGSEYLLWPRARGPSTRSLPVDVARPVRIDASGVWVAMTHEVPDARGDLLSVGRASGVSPAVSGVFSFAWHDSSHGAIGFIRHHEGRWGLWRSPAFYNPRPVADLGESVEPRLTAWGDWGWAISYPGLGQVTLLDPVGTPAATLEASVLGSGPGGVLLLTDTGVVLVTSNGSLQPLEMPRAVLGVILAGSISPDGSRAVVLTSTGVAVPDLDGDGAAVWHRIGGASAPVAWSSDSRFVIMPVAPRGVRVLDTATGEVSLVLDDAVVRWVGVIPLSGSS